MTTLHRASRRTRARLRRGSARLAGRLALTASLLAAFLGSQVPAAADGSPAPRIDLKVLLLTNSTSQPDFEAWQRPHFSARGCRSTRSSSRRRPTITQSVLSTTASDGAHEAKYEAIIEAPGGLGLSAASAAAIEDYERSFNVRQVTSDVFPSAAVGMNAADGVGSARWHTGSAHGGRADGVPRTSRPPHRSQMDYGHLRLSGDAARVGASPLTPLVSGPNVLRARGHLRAPERGAGARAAVRPEPVPAARLTCCVTGFSPWVDAGRVLR